MGDACKDAISRSIVIMLRALGCRYAQGYCFWKPLPEADLLAFMDGPSVRARVA